MDGLAGAAAKVMLLLGVSAEPTVIAYFGLAATVWLACGWLLPRSFPSRKIRPDWPPARQYWAECLKSLRMIIVSSAVLIIFNYFIFPILYAWFGAVPKVHDPKWVLASFAATLVAHDTYFYWTHRLMHHPRLFRWMHLAHHRSFNPTPFSAYSFSFGEAVVQSLFLPLWFWITPTPIGVIVAEILFQVVHNMIDHSGYEVFPADRHGRPLVDWFKTVTHHDLHHEDGGNYALFFTWWDRLMATEHPAYYARFGRAVARSLPAAATTPGPV